MPTVLITGAARRVGRASAMAFARAGCDLVLTFNTSSMDIQATFDSASALGVKVRVDRLDLNDLEATEDYGRRLSAALPRLDVVVHNASVYAPTPLSTVSGEELLRFQRVNAISPLLMTRALAARLAQSDLSGGGSVVAMCDIHALGEHSLPRRDFVAYAMSKAGLAELVRVLARELAPKVRVNGVAPGVVAWPEEGYEADEAGRRAYLSRVPLGRAGTPEEAAEAVRWLALEARYVTGQIVRLDGGRSLV